MLAGSGRLLSPNKCEGMCGTTWLLGAIMRSHPTQGRAALRSTVRGGHPSPTLRVMGVSLERRPDGQLHVQDRDATNHVPSVAALRCSSCVDRERPHRSLHPQGVHVARHPSCAASRRLATLIMHWFPFVVSESRTVTLTRRVVWPDCTSRHGWVSSAGCCVF